MPLDLNEMINSGMSFPAIASELSLTWGGPKVKPKGVSWPFIKDGDRGRMSDLICTRDAAIKRLDWISRSTDDELQAEIMARYFEDVERSNRECAERDIFEARRDAFLDSLKEWLPASDLLKDYKHHLSRMIHDIEDDVVFGVAEYPILMPVDEFRKIESYWLVRKIAAAEKGIKAHAAHLKSHEAWQAELWESLGISVPDVEANGGDNGNT